MEQSHSRYFGDSWAEDIRSRRSGGFGANALKRILATLVPGVRRSNVTGDGADDALPARTGPSMNVDFAARLNSALTCTHNSSGYRLNL